MSIPTKRELNFNVGARRIQIFAPPQRPDRILYIHSSTDEAANNVPAALANGSAVARISGVNWDAELSPWPAPRAFAGGEDFAGRADEYLPELTGRILPAVTAALEAPEAASCIAGYSLAGLFALYAACRTHAFVRIASMSGSLWYDGFEEFLREQTDFFPIERCYLSLGSRESKTKNARMAKVEHCTRAAHDWLSAHGVQVKLEMHPGGHFTNISQRIERGLAEIG